MKNRLALIAPITTLACVLFAGSVQAQGKPALKPLEDAELSGVWGQALLDLTNTSVNGYDFSRLTVNADITMSTTLSGLKLGTHADGTSDIDITSLNFGRSDLGDAHRTVAITNPYFEWVYAGTAAGGDRQVVGMRVGFGGIAGDVGLAMNTVSGSLSLSTPSGQATSLGSQSDGTDDGCAGACSIALNQIGGVTAGDANGASRDFFLSVLKSAVAYPAANAAAGTPRRRHGAGRVLDELDRSPERDQHHRHHAAQRAQDRAMMPGGAVSAGSAGIGMRCRAAVRALVPGARSIRAASALLLAGLLLAPMANAQTVSSPAMRPLADDELAAVRGADGVAFNLSNFSLTSIPGNPLTLTYLSPNGSSLTLSGLDLSRTDDADLFADPYQLSLRSRPGLSDFIAIDFPLNVAGNQKWSLTADFAHCDAVTAGSCSGNNFFGGTLQVLDLTMKGGGLYVSTPNLADTQGIAFGLGTQLDIGSLSVYSRGRAAPAPSTPATC